MPGRRHFMHRSPLIWAKRAKLQLSSHRTWPISLHWSAPKVSSGPPGVSQLSTHSLCCLEASFVHANSSTRARAHAGFRKSLSSSLLTLNRSVLVLFLRLRALPCCLTTKTEFWCCCPAGDCNLNITAGWARGCRASHDPPYIYSTARL